MNALYQKLSNIDVNGDFIVIRDNKLCIGTKNGKVLTIKDKYWTSGQSTFVVDVQKNPDKFLYTILTGAYGTGKTLLMQG